MYLGPCQFETWLKKKDLILYGLYSIALMKILWILCTILKNPLNQMHKPAGSLSSFLVNPHIALAPISKHFRNT
ncbi:hypothetical protein CO251_13820 [Sulfobacillus sp. hq2]|nr:hypothetical protein CO251_13820 [Sulfobacillus sp. hq2]